MHRIQNQRMPATRVFAAGSLRALLLRRALLDTERERQAGMAILVAGSTRMTYAGHLPSQQFDQNPSYRVAAFAASVLSQSLKAKKRTMTAHAGAHSSHRSKQLLQPTLHSAKMASRSGVPGARGPGLRHIIHRDRLYESGTKLFFICATCCAF